jgi:hypothetical protein
MSGFVWNAQKLSIVFSTPAIPKAAERVEVTFEFKVD